MSCPVVVAGVIVSSRAECRLARVVVRKINGSRGWNRTAASSESFSGFAFGQPCLIGPEAQNLIVSGSILRLNSPGLQKWLEGSHATTISHIPHTSFGPAKRPSAWTGKQIGPTLACTSSLGKAHLWGAAPPALATPGSSKSCRAAAAGASKPIAEPKLHRFWLVLFPSFRFGGRKVKVGLALG